MMQRILRSLHTVGTRPIHKLNIPTVPRLAAPHPEIAFETPHIHNVHQNLEDAGILHIKLSFPDDNSSYIQKLILNLQKHHSHGLPITHSADRGWMWDIRPSADSFQSNNHQARSETMQEFPWHTDCSYESSPPRYFALQVLQPDKCGGGTLSALKVDNLIQMLSPSTRSWLSTPNYRIAVPPEFIKSVGETSIVGSLLVANPRGQGVIATEVRFREDIITPLCDEAAEALQELKTVLLGEEARMQTLHLTPEAMPRGSIILMDNRRWLHARNDVKDPNRHLRRVRWDARPFQGSATEELRV